MNKSILILSNLALLMIACKDNEVVREDSPYITVDSPTRNEMVDDTATVTINATIKPKNTSVSSYHVWLIDNDKKSILNEKTDCNCKGEASVKVVESFHYDINKTSDLLLHVDATLEDGTNIREEIPFRLVDVKK